LVFFLYIADFLAILTNCARASLPDGDIITYSTKKLKV